MLLRQAFGFCDSPLCVASKNYEYICAPNQDCHRFGNYIHYNSYSQRSEEPDTTKFVVLGCGDSVINGGVLTDHSEIATTLSSNDSVQVLNISAGSWGPDNCAAYLKQHGLFNAKAILLVVSSHDAHDVMDFKPIVGVHTSFPDKQYRSAYMELWDRYVKPRIMSVALDPDQQVNNNSGICKGNGPINPGFSQIKRMADDAGIKLIVYLHPEIVEIEDGKFNSQGQEILNWAKENNIEVTTGFENGENKDDFRDNIHLNAAGQKKLSRWMTSQISQLKQ